MTDGLVTLTNLRCWSIYDSLLVLGRRKCATLNSDLKVARLIRWIQPFAEPIGPMKQKAALGAINGRDAEKLSPIDVQIIQLQIADAGNVLDEQTVDVPLPKGRIMQDDLPKEMSGDNGWKNAEALGAVVAGLDFLYEFPEE